MKKRLILIIPMVLLVTSFVNRQRNPLDPIGMVQIDDNFWVNQTEVLTRDWIEYFNVITRDSGVFEAAKLRPTLLNNWVVPSSRENLHRQRVFNNTPTSMRNLLMAPITYLTYEQAVAYCEWKSKMMNHQLRQLRINKTIRFRLPTEEEWTKILAYNKKWEVTKLRRSNRYVNKIDKRFRHLAVFQIPSTLRDNRVYQLYHNVSEMTAEKGVAIGMNNLNFRIDGNLDIKTGYNSPAGLLGFRCVAEYID